MYLSLAYFLIFKSAVLVQPSTIICQILLQSFSPQNKVQIKNPQFLSLKTSSLSAIQSLLSKKKEVKSSCTGIICIEVDHGGDQNGEAIEVQSGMVPLYSFNTVLAFTEQEEKIKNLKELLYFFSK